MQFPPTGATRPSRHSFASHRRDASVAPLFWLGPEEREKATPGARFAAAVCVGSVMLDKAGPSVLLFSERCYPLRYIARFGVSIPQEFVAAFDAFIEHPRGEARQAGLHHDGSEPGLRDGRPSLFLRTACHEYWNRITRSLGVATGAVVCQ